VRFGCGFGHGVALPVCHGKVCDDAHSVNLAGWPSPTRHIPVICRPESGGHVADHVTSQEALPSKWTAGKPKDQDPNCGRA
jgi:hypothetical protein